MNNFFLQITLNLWGIFAESFNLSENDVITLKRVKVTEYNGIKKLTTTNSTLLENDFRGEEQLR